MEIKVAVQLVGVELVEFTDGTVRPKASVKLDSGAVCDVWGTNEGGPALIALKDAPMGQAVTLGFEVRSKNNKLGLHLVGASAASKGA